MTGSVHITCQLSGQDIGTRHCIACTVQLSRYYPCLGLRCLNNRKVNICCKTHVTLQLCNKINLVCSISTRDGHAFFFYDSYTFICSHLGPGEFGGEDDDDGKANLRGPDGISSEESTRSGMPGDVLTVSVTTSSGSKTNNSS